MPEFFSQVFNHAEWSGITQMFLHRRQDAAQDIQFLAVGPHSVKQAPQLAHDIAGMIGPQEIDLQ